MTLIKRAFGTRFSCIWAAYSLRCLMQKAQPYPPKGVTKLREAPGSRGPAWGFLFCTLRSVRPPLRFSGATLALAISEPGTCHRSRTLPSLVRCRCRKRTTEPAFCTSPLAGQAKPRSERRHCQRRRQPSAWLFRQSQPAHLRGLPESQRHPPGKGHGAGWTRRPSRHRGNHAAQRPHRLCRRGARSGCGALAPDHVKVLTEQLRQTKNRFNVGEVTRTDVA